MEKDYISVVSRLPVPKLIRSKERGGKFGKNRPLRKKWSINSLKIWHNVDDREWQQ